MVDGGNCKNKLRMMLVEVVEFVTKVIDYVGGGS